LSDPPDGASPVPVTRVELRRASLLEICHADQAIRACALMRSLEPAEAERLLGGSVAKRYADGAAVYREGDEGCSAYLVLRGEVRLSSGRNVVFAVARKGDVFGEAELVTQPPARGSTAVAAGETDVVELPAPLLMEVGRANRRLVELIQQIYQGRHAATREIADFINRW
jgi:CRP-like cAMP-binding protein